MFQKLIDRFMAFDKLRFVLYLTIIVTLFIGLVNAYQIGVNIEDFYALILYFSLLFIFDLFYTKWISIFIFLAYTLGLYYIFYNSMVMFYRFFQCRGTYFYVDNLGSLFSLVFVFFLLIVFVGMKLITERKKYFQVAFIVMFTMFSVSFIVFQLDVFFDILPNCFVALSDIYNPPVFPYGIYEYSSIQNIQFLIFGIKDVMFLLLFYTMGSRKQIME
ncbi:MAG: hypothetical protein AB7U79_03740 [Candidatus Izemoplasmatales bacterium]